MLRVPRRKGKRFSLRLFLLLSAPTSSSPLSNSSQDVEQHHEVDSDHGGRSGEHEAPGVVQRGAPEERGDEGCF